jgi:hypothetical protein
LRAISADNASDARGGYALRMQSETGQRHNDGDADLKN